MILVWGLMACGALRAPPQPAFAPDLAIRKAVLLNDADPPVAELDVVVAGEGLWLGDVAWSLGQGGEALAVHPVLPQRGSLATGIELPGGDQRVRVSLEEAELPDGELQLSGTIWYRRRPAGPLESLSFTELLARPAAPETP